MWLGVVKSVMAGPMMDAAFLTYEGITSDPVENYLNLEKPVWVLGKYFKPDEQMDNLNEDILSRLWFTYRKNFPAIGGTGPISDAGWGCMLRCGQMMLAQALVCRHLGREWNWRKQRKDSKYMMILKQFLDKKDSLYSIHQIAQMGVGEGKGVGQWFGPNTVAQVIKKLVLFDDWSDIAVHVAMDNTVVMEDIKKLCQSQTSSWGCYGTCSFPKGKTEGKPSTSETYPQPMTPSTSTPCSCGDNNPFNFKSNPNELNDKKLPAESDSKWRPLLLFIPLRLGLSEINSDYYPSLKAMFTLKQSLGVIGGKPNHAHYFVGFNGDRLLYLDPHTTQQTIDVEYHSNIPDESYHSTYPCFMNFAALDPSIALGFYCHTEAAFDDWVHAVRELVIDREKRPMFEICEDRPRHWPPFEFPKRPCHDLDNAKSDFTELTYDYGEESQIFDSSGEYEIL